MSGRFVMIIQKLKVSKGLSLRVFYEVSFNIFVCDNQSEDTTAAERATAVRLGRECQTEGRDQRESRGDRRSPR